MSVIISVHFSYFLHNLIYALLNIWFTTSLKFVISLNQAKRLPWYLASEQPKTWPSMATNSYFMSHTFRAAGGWWDISLQRQPWETTCEKREAQRSFSHPGSASSSSSTSSPLHYTLYYTIHHHTAAWRSAANSKKFLNIVVSPENVLTHIPWERAMNGNLYNEKCKALGNIFSHELY